MREEVNIKIVSNDDLLSFVEKVFTSRGASNWTRVIGSLDQQDCVFGDTTPDRSTLFSLHCDANVDGKLYLTWLPFDEEYLSSLKEIGVEVLSSFSYGGDYSKARIGRVADDASILTWMKTGETPEHADAVLSCERCGTLLLSGLYTVESYAEVPIYCGTGLTSGWCCAEDGSVAYVIRTKQSALVDVFASKASDLPLFLSFIIDSSFTLNTDTSSSPASEEQLDQLTQKLAELFERLELQNQRLSNLCSLTPDLKAIEAVVSKETERQSDNLSEKIKALSTSLEVQEVREKITDLESHMTSPEAIQSLGESLNTVLGSLIELRSYDDELRDLVSTMSASLKETYNEMLAKARDVALKDVSLSNSVTSLSDALEKLGSLRSLAEKSDSALDSLVTLLPALSSMESNIVSGARQLSDDCAKLSEVHGKVEACAEQALSSTLSSNNTLSAIKDASAKKDIALVTMTALTAVASVASSVASIRQAKGGPRC